MPETCFPIRTRRRVPIPSLALALLWVGLALGGCSGGDFGRTRQDVLNDDMHRWIGGEATSSIGLRASQFQLTDNERLLRDLAYRRGKACSATISRFLRPGGSRWYSTVRPMAAC